MALPWHANLQETTEVATQQQVACSPGSRGKSGHQVMNAHSGHQENGIYIYSICLSTRLLSPELLPMGGRQWDPSSLVTK